MQHSSQFAAWPLQKKTESLYSVLYVKKGHSAKQAKQWLALSDASSIRKEVTDAMKTFDCIN